jgi:hypothetical protein
MNHVQRELDFRRAQLRAGDDPQRIGWLRRRIAALRIQAALDQAAGDAGVPPAERRRLRAVRRAEDGRNRILGALETIEAETASAIARRAHTTAEKCKAVLGELQATGTVVPAPVCKAGRSWPGWRLATST